MSDEIGTAMLKLQDYVQAGHSKEEFDLVVERAGKIVEFWVMHPKGREWELVQNIEELTRGILSFGGFPELKIRW